MSTDSKGAPTELILPVRKYDGREINKRFYVAIDVPSEHAAEADAFIERLKQLEHESSSKIKVHTHTISTDILVEEIIHAITDAAWYLDDDYNQGMTEGINRIRHLCDLFDEADLHTDDEDRFRIHGIDIDLAKKLGNLLEL